MTKKTDENTFNKTAHHSAISSSILRLRRLVQELPKLDNQGLMNYRREQLARTIEHLLTTLELHVTELLDELGDD